MRFSSFFALGLATLAIASPVVAPAEKRALEIAEPQYENAVREVAGSVDELIQLDKKEDVAKFEVDSIAGGISGVNKTVTLVVQDIEDLLKTIVVDIANIATSVGLDYKVIFQNAGISATVNPTGSPATFTLAVITLIADTIKGLVKIAADAGVSFFSLLGSALG